MFIQPLGEKPPCLIDRDRVSFHQSMRRLRVLAFEEPLFNVIRQLKAMHPDLRSCRVLIKTHHIPAVAKQYHWSKLSQNNVTTLAGAVVGNLHQGKATVHIQQHRVYQDVAGWRGVGRPDRALSLPGARWV
jgi:hypothetical protein